MEAATAPPSLVEALAASTRELRLLREPHRGKGAAVKAGALAARGAVVLFCDADLCHPVEDLTRFAGYLDRAAGSDRLAGGPGRPTARRAVATGT